MFQLLRTCCSWCFGREECNHRYYFTVIILPEVVQEMDNQCPSTGTQSPSSATQTPYDRVVQCLHEQQAKCCPTCPTVQNSRRSTSGCLFLLLKDRLVPSSEKQAWSLFWKTGVVPLLKVRLIPSSEGQTGCKEVVMRSGPQQICKFRIERYLPKWLPQSLRRLVETAAFLHTVQGKIH